LDKIKSIEVCQCVFCGRKNSKQNRTKAEGSHLRFIRDDADGTYHCNECDEAIRHVIQNLDYYCPPKGNAWLKETEDFENSLDFDLSEEEIDRIIREENS
jgi:hypothetical protein